MSLLLLTRSLNLGGAERQLVTLARALHARGHAVAVACFYAGGPLSAELEAAGVPVHALDKRGTWDTLGFLGRLAALLRRERVSVLHSYLPTPNVLALALKPLFPGVRFVWGVRASNMDLSRYSRLSRLAYGLEARLSRFADRVVANSRAGRDHAVASGFPAERLVVIPNGIDTSRFAPGAASSLRAAWGFGPAHRVIGLVARLDPMKDHPGFLAAAARLGAERPEVRFVVVGDGPAPYRAALEAQAAALGLHERLVWAGAQHDMPAVYAALDLATSASITEGFPNVVGEAMASGVPCVVTDVGDSAWIVGPTGEVVPARDPEALAAGWGRLLDRLSPELRRAARERITAHFSVERLVSASEEALWLSSVSST